MKKSPYFELKEEAWNANLEIPKRNLAIYTWGNVSAFDENKGVFAIKPSGVAYDELKIEDIVVLDLEGNKVEGKMKPSSDTATHLELYRSFALNGKSCGKIKGITHTHSPYATSFAQAGKYVPLFGTTHADHCANAVLCTPLLTEMAVNSNYELETGKLIVESFKNPPKSFLELCSNLGNLENLENSPQKDTFTLVPHENPMVLVCGHGPFTWGENAHKSVYNAAVLEEVCKMAFLTLQINPNASQLANYIVQKHYQRKHGKNAYYGQG